MRRFLTRQWLLTAQLGCERWLYDKGLDSNTMALAMARQRICVCVYTYCSGLENRRPTRPNSEAQDDIGLVTTRGPSRVQTGTMTKPELIKTIPE